MIYMFRLPCGWIGFKTKEMKANHTFYGGNPNIEELSHQNTWLFLLSPY